MLNFLMLVHNHQPIGNFDHVMESSFQKSYKPFLDVFFEFDLKLSLHISGPLFDWLNLNHPEYIEKVRSLVSAGRIEIVGSGYYEPILAAIPQDDAIDQISLYKSSLEKSFNTNVVGSWLTERVWEPHLPKIFRRAGIDYIVTDDYHFLRSGFSYEELGGYFLTDYDNHTLAVYPGSEMLRYIMPFSTIDKIHSFFRESYEKGIKTLVFADDGEKFGVWPETYKWVYQENWLRAFFQFLTDNRDWIKTQTIKEHCTNSKPEGCCYLPTTSYPELGEWALPTNASVRYRKNLDLLKSNNNFDEIKAFYQGGQWKNFLTKYREGRILYRKMHYVSENLRNKPLKQKTSLFKAQCNDAYWHGIFGGLYLPHLRREVNSHLIKAAKSGFKKNFFDLYDFDLDGADEIFLKNEKLALIISPEDGATVISVDSLEKDLTLTDTLKRRVEPYHLKIGEAKGDSGGTKTIHEQFKTKEDGLEKLLYYDRYEKTSFRCHILNDLSGNIAKDLLNSEHNITSSKYDWEKYTSKSGDGITFSAKFNDTTCLKTVLLKDNVIQTSINVKAGEPYRFVALEWNFNLFAPDADDRFILINREIKKHLNFEGVFENVKDLSLTDEWYGISIDFAIEGFDYIYLLPVYTVSLSEGGVEKTFQGTSIVLVGGMKDGAFKGKTDLAIKSSQR